MNAEDFKNKWLARFPDNTTGEIEEGDFRELVGDITLLAPETQSALPAEDDPERRAKLVLPAALGLLEEVAGQKVDKAEGKGLSTNDYTNEEKAKVANFSKRYKGPYTSLEALVTANPTGELGDYADVDPGEGIASNRYIWDMQEGWVPGSSTGNSFVAATPEQVAGATDNTSAVTPYSLAEGVMGYLYNLATASKISLVSALNELVSRLNSLTTRVSNLEGGTTYLAVLSGDGTTRTYKSVTQIQNALKAMVDTDIAYLNGYYESLEFRRGTIYAYGAYGKYINFGEYPNAHANGRTLTVYGIGVTLRLAFLATRWGDPSRYTVVDARTYGNAYYGWYGAFASTFDETVRTQVIMQDCRGISTAARIDPQTNGAIVPQEKGGGVFRFGDAPDGAGVDVYMIDCQFNSKNNGVISGMIKPNSRIHLQGETKLRTDAAGVPVYELVAASDSHLLSADETNALIIDERS